MLPRTLSRYKVSANYWAMQWSGRYRVSLRISTRDERPKLSLGPRPGRHATREHVEVGASYVGDFRSAAESRSFRRSCSRNAASVSRCRISRAARFSALCQLTRQRSEQKRRPSFFGVNGLSQLAHGIWAWVTRRLRLRSSR